MKEVIKMSIKDNRNFRFETKQLHTGQENPDSATDARAVPIHHMCSEILNMLPQDLV